MANVSGVESVPFVSDPEICRIIYRPDLVQKWTNLRRAAVVWVDARARDLKRMAYDICAGVASYASLVTSALTSAS